MVLSLQNGIDNEDRIAAVVGADHVLGAHAQIVATIAAPGLIEQPSPLDTLVFSELHDGTSPRAERLLATFQHAGMTTELRSDGRVHLWEKFVNICAYSGVTSLLRLPLGPIFACPESFALYRSVLDENMEVGRATGVALGPQVAEQIMRSISNLAAGQPSATSSMQRDLAAGHRLELDGLNGTVVRLGHEYGVPTPNNAVIYAALKPFSAGTPVVSAA
jgi:2-dehydropantoate 2-reductase